MKTCTHEGGAVFGCGECAHEVRSRFREFPLQSDRHSKPGPISIPWLIAEQAWAHYSARCGRDQSVERLAERGGFGWVEMDRYLPGWREMVDPYRTLLAENARLRDEIQRLNRSAKED